MSKSFFRRLPLVPPRLRLSAGVAAAALLMLAGQAHADCSTSASGGMPPWMGGLTCSAANTATGLITLNTTLAIDFFTFASPFVTSAAGTAPNTIQSGVWVRGVGGQSTTTTNFNVVGTGSLGGQSLSGSTKIRTDFDGVQGGVDSGMLDLGGGGWNAHFGATFGSAWAKPHLSANDGSESASDPFVGLYAVFTKGNYFAHLQIRHGWESIDVDNAALGLFGGKFKAQSTDVSAATGYRINIESYFVEPTVGINFSNTSVSAFSIPGNTSPSNPVLFVPPTNLNVNSIPSALGFIGTRIGTAFSTSSLAIQPYVTASLFHQFDGDINAQITCTNLCPPNVGANASATQIGTFGQFGAGVATQILNTGLVSYVRGDYRVGDRYEAWTLSGGLRYTF